MDDVAKIITINVIFHNASNGHGWTTLV